MTDKNMAFNTRKEKKKKKGTPTVNEACLKQTIYGTERGGGEKNLEKTKKLPHKILRSTCS